MARDDSSATRIMGAAESLFGAQGYTATSISEICERSGLPVGSIYHHFGSKEKLLVAILKRAVVEVEEAIARAGEQPSVIDYFEHASSAINDHMSVMRIDGMLGLGYLDPGLRHEIETARKRTEVNVARELTRLCRQAGVVDYAELVEESTELTLAVVYGGVALEGLLPGRFRSSLTLLARWIDATITARSTSQRQEHARKECEESSPR